MAEFKRLSDVEVVAEPAKSANVLIEEDGVIKKAPKTTVGREEEVDLVISLSAPFAYDTPTAENTSVTIESGSLVAVAEALREGRAPVVKCKRYYLYSGFNTSFPVAEGCIYDCEATYYGGMLFISFVTPYGYTLTIHMNINDAEYL